jgi:hypothetical protein
MVGLLGCGQGTDSHLTSEFPPLRADLSEMRSLLIKLQTESGIGGIKIGHVVRYNETKTPDAIWLDGQEGLFNYTEVMAKQPVSRQNQLTQLLTLARKLECEYAAMREGQSFWVAMKYGGTFAPDVGYLHKGTLNVLQVKKGNYYAIPGENDWYVFVR